MCTPLDPESIAEPLARLQSALGRVLRSLIFRGDPNSPFVEMPVSQLKCLHVIAEHEGLKMVELATHMETKLPALSQIVDRLVRRGMLARQADPQDRRVVRLVLTDRARELVREGEAHRMARLAATVHTLTARQADMAIEGLIVLAGAAEMVEAEERRAAAPFSPDSGAVAEIVARRSGTLSRTVSVEVSPAASSGSQ